jgi:hypothetical protein
MAENQAVLLRVVCSILYKLSSRGAGRCLLLCPLGTPPCIGTIVALNVAVSANRKVRQLIWLAFQAEIDRASEPVMKSLEEGRVLCGSRRIMSGR